MENYTQTMQHFCACGNKEILIPWTVDPFQPNVQWTSEKKFENR
jgi:hypothetical protein